jgi:hypothetical protein
VLIVSEALNRFWIVLRCECHRVDLRHGRHGVDAHTCRVEAVIKGGCGQVVGPRNQNDPQTMRKRYRNAAGAVGPEERPWSSGRAPQRAHSRRDTGCRTDLTLG